MPIESPIKAEVKIGERAVEKLLDAAMDAFSPATETLGFLGDAIRLARVEVAAAITRKAKAIAVDQGLKLTAPPLKFLVPFYEKASTENVDDNVLLEMWARLLASAGSDYSARHLRYTTLLSELSATQARILHGIATNYDGLIGETVDQDGLFYNFVESRLVSTLRGIADEDVDKIFESIMNEICVAGASVVLIQVETKKEKDMYDWASDEVYSDKISVDYDILRSVGLIERIETDFVELKYAYVSVILYRMTELGYSFWSACHVRSSVDGKSTDDA